MVDLNSVAEATLNSDGQIILTAEDGHGEYLYKKINGFNIKNRMILFTVTGYPVSVSGVITVPVSASMYQTMVANIQHLQTNSDGTVCVAPVVQVPKVNTIFSPFTTCSRLS